MNQKMHAFVSTVIEMGKVERNYKAIEIIHEYIDDLRTLRNAFGKFSRRERRWKVSTENQPDSVAKVLNARDIDSYSNTYVLLKPHLKIAATSCEYERSGIILK